MTEMKIYDDEDSGDMKYDFALEETVLFEIVYGEHDPENTTGWRRFDFVNVIIKTKSKLGHYGAASYEHYEGGVLEEHIKDSVTPPENSGIYALDNVVGLYVKGEWGYSEDEVRLSFGELREATDEEKHEFDDENIQSG